MGGRTIQLKAFFKILVGKKNTSKILKTTLLNHTFIKSNMNMGKGREEEEKKTRLSLVN